MTFSAKISNPIVQLHSAVILFGFSSILGKLIPLSASVIVMGRTAFAALALWLFVKWQKQNLAWLVSKKIWQKRVISGALLAIHWVSFFIAIQKDSVAIALLGFATFPLFTTLFEPLLFSERLTRRDLYSCFLVSIGLVLIVPEWRFSATSTQALLIAIGSAFSFAMLVLYNRHASDSDKNAVTSAFWQNAIASLCVSPMLFGQAFELSAHSLGLLVALGVLCTALAHGLFIASLGTLTARQAAIVTALEPIYGIIIAWVWLHEVPAASVLLGGLLILIASTMASFNKKQSTEMKEEK